MRKKFNWLVTLAATDGQTIKWPISAYWSPNKLQNYEIGEAARAEARYSVKNQLDFAVVSVERED